MSEKRGEVVPSTESSVATPEVSNEEDESSPQRFYRENPARALYVDEPIGEGLYKRLLREYHELRAASNDPITVYISSPGGSLNYLDWIRDLLFTPDQDGERPQIITVAKGMAASAAARLLVDGDYSMCYPSSLIHCHGTRISSVDDLTREVAEALGRNLRFSNRSTAIEFTEKILCSLSFIYDANRSEIEESANTSGDPPILAFAHLVESNLSSSGQLVMSYVYEDLEENADLGSFLTSEGRDVQLHDAEKKGQLDYDSLLLKIITDFVFSRSKDSYDPEQAVEDIERLYRARRVYFEDALTNISDNHDMLMLHVLDQQAFTKWDSMPPGDEKQDFMRATTVRLLFPLWQLASSIAHRLVVGENPLEGADAYWLGLVNEVVGMNYPCARQILEA